MAWNPQVFKNVLTPQTIANMSNGVSNNSNTGSITNTIPTTSTRTITNTTPTVSTSQNIYTNSNPPTSSSQGSGMYNMWQNTLSQAQDLYKQYENSGQTGILKGLAQLGDMSRQGMGQPTQNSGLISRYDTQINNSSNWNRPTVSDIENANKFNNDFMTMINTNNENVKAQEELMKQKQQEQINEYNRQMAEKQRLSQQAAERLNNLLDENKTNFFLKRNDTDTRRLMDLKRMKEESAAKGLYFDSQDTTNQIAQNLVSENAINQINQDESNYIRDITQQLSQLDSNTSAELQALADRKLQAMSTFGAEGDALRAKANEDIMNKLIQLQRDNRDYQYKVDDRAYQRQQDELQKQIDTLGQYYNDFDAEIQRRMNVNPNDPMIPYLRMLQQDKIKNTNDANKKYYYDLFNQIGIINSDAMAQALGIPKGTKTTDYIKTLYDINKPYSSEKPTQTQQTNQSLAEDYNSLKGLSVKDAMSELLNGRGDYISTYGISGFKELWDTVLADAIRSGQALPYGEYFKSQS